MLCTTVGGTEVPAIALGTWSWGTGINGGNSVFGNNLSEQDLKPVYEKAMSEGLILWDTAAVYGMGASETILGNLTSSCEIKPLLSTKFTPMALQAKSALEKSLQKSMTRLKADAADIYWIHNPSNIKKWTSETIPLIKSGLIKHVGVSNHSLEDIILADKILKDAGLKLDAVQNHYSLLYRASEETGIFKWCEENKVKFFSYMVLEQGALTGRYDAEHPFPPKTRRAKAFGIIELTAIAPLIDMMKKLGAKYNAGPAEIAVSWAITKGTLPIIGVTKVSHIDSAVKAAGIVLTPDEITTLETAAKATGIKIKASWEKEF